MRAIQTESIRHCDHKIVQSTKGNPHPFAIRRHLPLAAWPVYRLTQEDFLMELTTSTIHSSVRKMWVSELFFNAGTGEATVPHFIKLRGAYPYIISLRYFACVRIFGGNPKSAFIVLVSILFHSPHINEVIFMDMLFNLTILSLISAMD